MAPERLIRGTLNASGDIYCLGVVLFELLTGRHPYPERGPAQILAVLGTDAPRPSSLVADLPVELDNIAARALSRDPMLRYQSGRELGRDLNRVLAFVDAPRPVPEPSVSTADTDTPRRDPAFWMLAGVAAIPAIFIALTVAGFASVILYNSPLGRTGDFEPESPLWWPVRGMETLAAPIVAAVVVAVLMVLASFLGRLATIGPLGRWAAPVIGRARRVAAVIGSQPTAVLAPGILFLQLVAIGLAFWRFQPVFEGLDSFINRRPPTDLSALRPQNRAEHNLFTEMFALQVIVFGSAWYGTIKHRRRRRERDGLPAVVAGLAVTALSLLFGQIFPFRILYHNKHERVLYGSQQCYMVGQRGDDALLFCPRQPPPWNEIVKLNDVALRRAGAVESIFTGFNRGQ